jgi:sigma-54 dependent transcriptional regulator, acetoin dehydrogenase operon transcriptional activator AcoR
VWEMAQSPAGEPREVILASGRAIELDSEPIAPEQPATGYVMRMRAVHAAPERSARVRRSEVSGLPGLVGHSRAWRECVRLVRDAVEHRVPLVLVGRAGSGKSSIAAAATAGLDVVRIVGAETPAILDRVREAVSAPPGALVIDPLPARREHREAVVELLDSLPADVQIVATIAPDALGAETGLPAALPEWPGDIVPVPPLEDRIEDLPLLLDALSRGILRDGGAPGWSPDAVRVLGRQLPPITLATLAAVVRATLATRHGAVIGVADLPPAIRAQGSRRALVGLELVEARAILQALTDADGNKSRAALALAIDRSTLHRKMKALGLDEWGL